MSLYQRFGGTLGLCLALTTLAPAAHAADQSAAAAEDLFQRGKSAMRASDFATACPLLAESYRLDPAGGTLQNLAVCYEGLGKLASAYARFEELRTVSKNSVPRRDDRIELAESHLQALVPRLSRVFITSPRAEVTPRVTIDGAAYEPASWGVGILLDPGEHELVASATGKQPYTTTLRVDKDRTALKVALPRLEDAPVAATPGAEDPEVEARRRRAQTLRTAGFVSGGVGLAVLAGGAVFGGLAFASNAASEDACPSGPGSCVEGSTQLTEANSKRGEARTFATLSNVLVPVGVVGLGLGAVLLWQSGGHNGPKQNAKHVQMTPSLGGLSLSGRF